jgi:hypothetical protein
MRRANGNVTGWALAAACVAVSPASATWTPGQLFGDSYIVREGDHVYSVLDVYIKCSSSADIISSVFGVTAYTSDFSLSGGKVFAQSNGASAAAWLPVNNDGSAWDSFVTCGCRVQGSNTALGSGQAGFLGMQLDTNWAPSSSGGQIVGQAGGAGWYPSIGASTSTNPYAKVGQYSGTGPVNTAKCTKTISGNGIAIGQSLSNYWMIGRFSIDVVEDDVGVSQSMGLRFAVAGKNNGTTTFPCGPGPCTANRFDWTLTFAPRPCIGDIDSDGLCDGWDLGLLLLDFGPCPACPTDIDGNGTVDPGDMSLLLMDWNAPC